MHADLIRTVRPEHPYPAPLHLQGVPLAHIQGIGRSHAPQIDAPHKLPVPVDLRRRRSPTGEQEKTAQRRRGQKKDAPQEQSEGEFGFAVQGKHLLCH